MTRSIFSHLFKTFTLFTLLASPLTARAGDPMTVVDFNNYVFKNSIKAVRYTLDLAGEDSSTRCDDLMILAANAMYSCLREKVKCSESTAVDGTPNVPCTVGTNDECDKEPYNAAENFWRSSTNLNCRQLTEDVTKPGCGNLIREFGEDCDLGNTNGTSTAACSDQCKTVVPVAPVDAAAVPPAPAPAAPDSGQATTATTTTTATTAATGSCALHPDVTPDVSLWNLLVSAQGKTQD